MAQPGVRTWYEPGVMIAVFSDAYIEALTGALPTLPDTSAAYIVAPKQPTLSVVDVGTTTPATTTDAANLIPIINSAGQLASIVATSAGAGYEGASNDDDGTDDVEILVTPDSTAAGGADVTGATSERWTVTLTSGVITGIAAPTSGDRIVFGSTYPRLHSLSRWLMMVQQTTTTPIGESTTARDPEVTRVTGKPDSGMLQISLRRSYSTDAVHALLAPNVGKYARVWIQSQENRVTDAVSDTATDLMQASDATNPIIVTDVIVTDIMRIDADVAMTDASMMAMQWPITGDIVEMIGSSS